MIYLTFAFRKLIGQNWVHSLGRPRVPKRRPDRVPTTVSSGFGCYVLFLTLGMFAFLRTWQARCSAVYVGFAAMTIPVLKWFDEKSSTVSVGGIITLKLQDDPTRCYRVSTPSIPKVVLFFSLDVCLSNYQEYITPKLNFFS